jgi:hypothetical protein
VPSPNNATIQKVFIFPSGLIRIQPGQQVFANLTEAINFGGNETFLLETNISDNGLYLGSIAVIKSATNLSNLSEAVFMVAAGVSTNGITSNLTTIQQAFDISSIPQIITGTGAHSSLTIRRGSASDADVVFATQNGAGTNVLSISGNGLITASALTIDTNSLFVDAVNHRVGIGTTTPGAGLEVKGTAGNDIFKLTNSTGNVAFQIDNSTLNAKFWAGNATTPGISTTADTNTGFTWGNADDLYVLTGGSVKMKIDSNGNVGIGTTVPTAVLHLKAGTATANTAPLKFTSGALNTTAEAGAVEFLTDAFYGTITTGVIRKMFVMSVLGRVLGQSAANASIVTYTLGATDASFEVSSNILITTSNAEAFTVEVTYTDEGNTVRVLTLNFSHLNGTISPSISFTNGAVPYEGIPSHIRCKANTTITIGTVGDVGTFPGVVYNAEGIIKQIGN